jgi:hypothetical protein
MFFRRGTLHHDDPWLTEKLWLFTAGAVSAMLGMLLDNSWLMGVGALLLACGVLIRFLPRGEHYGEPEEGVEPGDAEPGETPRQHDEPPA